MAYADDIIMVVQRDEVEQVAELVEHLDKFGLKTQPRK